MSAHTPGPWQPASLEHAWDEIVGNVDGEYEDERGLVCTYTRICEIQADGPISEQQANARLICAAPDLLAALQAIVKHYGFGSNDSGRWLAANAAIAKATQP